MPKVSSCPRPVKSGRRRRRSCPEYAIGLPKRPSALALSLHQPELHSVRNTALTSGRIDYLPEFFKQPLAVNAPRLHTFYINQFQQIARMSDLVVTPLLCALCRLT